MKKQIFVIHGGDTFETYEEYVSFLKNWKVDFDKYKEKRTDWKANLQDDLGENFEVITPKMPSKLNAKYLEWKIWFEKFIPFMEKGVVLVGHSLGGTFLVKYFSENDVSLDIKAVFLVAPVYEKDTDGYTLADFKLPDNLSGLEKQGGNIFIYHSEDDPVVPFESLKKFKEKIPSVEEKIFKDRKHFNQEGFPEITVEIKELY